MNFARQVIEETFCIFVACIIYYSFFGAQDKVEIFQNGLYFIFRLCKRVICN